MSRSHSTGGRRRWTLGRREIDAARAFYCDVLGGRQLRPAGLADADARLWFRVGGAVIETGPEVRGAWARVVLGADDPFGLAERCWNAGFSVRVNDDAAGRMLLSVVDPFGRQIDLVPSNDDRPASRAGEE